jgi:hypothetical protein
LINRAFSFVRSVLNLVAEIQKSPRESMRAFYFCDASKFNTPTGGKKFRTLLRQRRRRNPVVDMSGQVSSAHSR